MGWLADLAAAQPVAHAVLVLASIAVLGLALSALRIRGVGLGVAGVLFAGILAGHLGFRIDPDILAFVREFGLILFVFTIGMQLGPGFFASLRREGLRFNLLATAVVFLGEYMDCEVIVGGQVFCVKLPPELEVSVGSMVNVQLPRDSLIILP